MSIAALPRIVFQGEMSWDPSLSNNFDDVHDPITSTYKLPPGETPASLREKLKSYPSPSRGVGTTTGPTSGNSSRSG